MTLPAPPFGTDPVFAPAWLLGLRVVGDVHGDARGFAHACATDRFVLQLGDLVDFGPDSPGVLARMAELTEARQGAMLLGNHDWRWLQTGRAEDEPARTLLRGARCWARLGASLFAHAAFHPAMLAGPAPRAAELPRHPRGAVARALYGQPTGRIRADGHPERSLAWVDQVPDGLSFACGHDRRSRDGRPLRLHGRSGGSVLFLDTGAGKGGHLSWVDLDPPNFTPPDFTPS